MFLVRGEKHNFVLKYKNMVTSFLGNGCLLVDDVTLGENIQASQLKKIYYQCHLLHLFRPTQSTL